MALFHSSTIISCIASNRSYMTHIHIAIIRVSHRFVYWYGKALQNVAICATLQTSPPKENRHATYGKDVHARRDSGEVTNLSLQSKSNDTQGHDSRYQSRWTMASPSRRLPKLSRFITAPETRKRQIKKAGTHQHINNTLAAQLSLIVFQATSDSLSPRYLYVHCSLDTYQKSRLASEQVRWWRYVS